MPISSKLTQDLLEREDVKIMIDDLDDLILDGGLDAVLDYVRNHMINPDEAFLLGFATFKKIDGLSTGVLP